MVKAILALLTVPFALFGLDTYFQNHGDKVSVAEVNGHAVSQQEFDQALTQQKEQLRQMLGPNADPALLDSALLRQQVLQGLISQHVLVDEAHREHLSIPDAELAQVITHIPAFQENGQFSAQRYQQLVQSRGMTVPMFEQQVRQDMLLTRMQDDISHNVILSRTAAEQAIRATQQQREVSVASVNARDLLPQVQVTPAEAQAYYNAHKQEFISPEQVRVAYAVLSPAQLASQVTVSDAEVQQYYNDHLSQYGTQEERRASHILIPVAANAPAAEQKKAEELANQVYAQAVKNPDQFAALAKQYSKDPGSAANGGDLGFFGRSDMVKPFADTVFAMQPGQISKPVKTQFGWHIIKLTGIKPASKKPLAEVKPEIVQTLKQEKASKTFNTLAETFSNKVYEQSDSLKPAADAVHVPVQQSGWITRSGSSDPLLGNKKVLNAIFSTDALKNKRNTDAIEAAPNTLVAAHVIDYKPQAQKPFTEVSETIRQKLASDKAEQMAKNRAQADIQALQAGKGSVSFGAAKTISRQQAQGLNPAVVEQAFKASTHHLPAYVSVPTPAGVDIIKVSRVINPATLDARTLQSGSSELAQMLGQDRFQAYLQSLKDSDKITIKKQALNPKSEQQ